jgi:hypothetical protein
MLTTTLILLFKNIIILLYIKTNEKYNMINLTIFIKTSLIKSNINSKKLFIFLYYKNPLYINLLTKCIQ